MNDMYSEYKTDDAIIEALKEIAKENEGGLTEYWIDHMLERFDNKCKQIDHISKRLNEAAKIIGHNTISECMMYE
jgi:hypothetical protein